MSLQYGAIGWNRQKKIYDIVLVSMLAVYLGLFVGVGVWRNPNATAETLLIRAFGTGALLLLHVVLCIGPLARLDRRFLPLLYNRRHLGVTTFLMGLAHGGFALFQFHALGNVNPLISLFVSNTRYGSIADFRFSHSDSCADHSFLYGGNQSRFLAAEFVGARVEKSSHACVRGLRTAGSTRNFGRAAIGNKSCPCLSSNHGRGRGGFTSSGDGGA